ncbi:MAG TPA: hypothetical protein VFC19_47675 [Candidatus Limnocylindrales bacterium]|nr:hypothetical protein [Candidatus Limnocylindrales bacterium]
MLPDDDLIQSTLRRMVWVFPDRESSRALPKWRHAFWDAYEEVAARLGLTWCRNAPDDVVVDATDRVPRVFVAGDEVTPADTLFVTSVYSLPYQVIDVFNQHAIHAVLEQCGFYLPIPPGISALINDKLATILSLPDLPIDPIPTIRIGTGRDLGFKFYAPVLSQVSFPAIVKPIGWGAGWGVCMAHNLEDLHGLLSLAQAGDTAVVIQPYLGPDTVDIRVNLLDGKPHSAMQRAPRKGGYVGNLGRGGRLEFVPVPAGLAGTLDYIAERFPIPFLCADFLFDGQRYWFSEIEPDGAIVAPDPESPADVDQQLSTIEARFRAYRQGHWRWLGHKVKEESHA